MRALWQEKTVAPLRRRNTCSLLCVPNAPDVVNRCGSPTTPSAPLRPYRGSAVSRVSVRRCRNQRCEWYHRPYRPEEEGRWALPHGEFGLDVIALVGSLRYTSHRSVPEIHQALCDRGVSIAERTVTHLLQRYEELVALHLADQQRLHKQFKEQGQIILAIDGLQPDVGNAGPLGSARLSFW